MESRIGERPRLPSLTGLRFPAALAVFGLHVVQRLSPGAVHDVGDFLAGRGYIGVSFFFVLSGFVLTWTARAGDDARLFYGRRFARIAPTYFVCWVVTWTMVFLASGKLATTVLPSMVAVQAWFPDPAVHFSINPPAWSIAAEAFFYVCFPLLVGLLASGRGRGCLRAFAVLLVVVPAAVLRPTTDSTADAALWATYVLPVPRLGEFVIGMLVADAVLRGWRPRLSLNASLGLLLCAYLATAGLPVWASISLATLTPICLVLASAAAADMGGRATLWSRPWMLRLGEWSFAFYLAQEACFRVQDEVQERWGSAMTELPLLAATLAVCLAAAAVVHTSIERPWETRLRPGSRGRVAPKRALKG